MPEKVYISMFIIWATIFLGALITELVTTIYLGWSATIAAAITLIVHAITRDIVAQIITFVVVWFALWIFMLFITIYIFKKKIIHDSEDGYMKYIGKEFIAHKSNKLGFGEIKDNDKIFRFSSKDKINVDQKVVVNEIKGVTFRVSKVTNKKKKENK